MSVQRCALGVTESRSDTAWHTVVKAPTITSNKGVSETGVDFHNFLDSHSFFMLDLIIEDGGTKKFKESVIVSEAEFSVNICTSFHFVPLICSVLFV